MNTEKLHHLIASAQNILLISHINPDRDAIGSIVGLHQILKQLGYESSMLVETPYNIKKGFLNGLENVIVDKLENHIERFDLIIILDTSVKPRFTRSKDEELLAGKTVIIIDHHVTQPDIDYELYLHEPVSSNAELIYNIFENDIELNLDIAKPLLMGIYDDTGGFRFPAVNAATLRTAAKLLDAGLNIADIAEESKEIDSRLFLGGQHIFANTVINHEHKYFYTYFSREFLEEYKYTYEDIEVVKDNFVTILLSMKDITWGLVIKPKPEEGCGISFRSKKDGPDVEEIARLFDGGGHKKASGGSTIESDPLLAAELITSKVNKFLEDK